MKVLVFDTETTGLPPSKTPTADDSDQWPYIVQLSYLLFDTDSNKITVQHDVILRVPVEIENSHIHRITTGLSKNGFDFKPTFEIFMVCVEACDVIVGHNVLFDVNMMRAECLRHQLTFNPRKEFYCTMKRSIHVCNLLNTTTGRLKYPKLSELHETLFGYTPKNLHNSLVDVMVCFRCYYHLKYDKDICGLVTTIKKYV